ncbi:MAG: hypothetical protein VW946_04970 [Gammaproteobacteria bacterium]
MVDRYDEPKSLKQFYRLWFEYVRLSQSELKWTKKDHQRYSEWGDISSYKNFDSWWKDKNYLFGDIRVLEGSSKHPDSLNLKIPLTQPITKSISQVKEILEKEIEERLTKVYGRKLTHQEKVKNLRLNHKKYPILGEPKYRKLDDDLIIYRDVYLKHGKPKGLKLLELVIKRFSNIKGRDKSNQVPEFMRNTQVWDRLPDSQVKNVRRSLERTRQVMENVKQGTFPTKK